MNKIDLTTPIGDIQDLLRAKHWISQDEYLVHMESPGEGNMNVVIRLKSDQRSFILKQSRPYVQKYQQIDAPIDRIDTEYQFYYLMGDSVVNGLFPKVLHYDEVDHLLMMSDLGECEDLTSIYASETIETGALSQLMIALDRIHTRNVPDTYPENLELRTLNHQHIFVLPFMNDNGFDLDSVQEGLQSLARDIKGDQELQGTVNQLGERYMATGDYLLHGDYYPGSWMMINDKIAVVDPEFSFVGFREYDLGVMAGHLIMASGDTNYLKIVMDSYPKQLDQALTGQIASVEIIRRLLGLAQLPLTRSIAQKRLLVNWAVSNLKK